MIAREESELCMRLRQQGWKILRIDGEMTELSQCWKRSVRAGNVYEEEG
jgi:hypothetical protein